MKDHLGPKIKKRWLNTADIYDYKASLRDLDLKNMMYFGF